MKSLAIVFTSILLPVATFADAPEILDVVVEKTGMTWRVDVTLEHPDTGWDHHADGWQVLDADGTVLGVRELMHPHVNEQPFTRSLTSLILPDGTREIFVRAHCTIDGWTEEPVRVELSP